jgi:hypothetical protein
VWAWLVPELGTTFSGMYRLYLDDWFKVDPNAHADPSPAHTFEVRLYQELTAALSVRLAYRYYTQGQAFFAKRTYGPNEPYYTSDPKLFEFDSHYGEIQGRFVFGGLAGRPLWAWLDGAAIDLTVGILYSGSTFGNCGPLSPLSECADRVISLGMTVPL